MRDDLSFSSPTDHIIIETENVKSVDREGRSTDASASYRLACPGLSDCVALRDCPQILVEATTRCYNSDRSLFCGVNQNFEPYVCCPTYKSPTYLAEGTNQFDAPDKLNGACGKSLIQASFYKKLGAFPYVARIGFKSEFLQYFRKVGHDVCVLWGDNWTECSQNF